MLRQDKDQDGLIYILFLGKVRFLRAFLTQETRSLRPQHHSRSTFRWFGFPFLIYVQGLILSLRNQLTSDLVPIAS